MLDLPLSPAGRVARDILLADQKLLRDAGLDPSLDLIPAYPREAAPGPVPIDVYDFHADSANTLADTFLCSYTVASSEGVANDEAVRRIDIPDTRAELLRVYGGADDAGFVAWIAEHCYDLHYAARPGAHIYSFGFGNLRRISTQCPGSPVPPCVHRAPAPPRACCSLAKAYAGRDIVYVRIISRRLRTLRSHHRHRRRSSSRTR